MQEIKIAPEHRQSLLRVWLPTASCLQVHQWQGWKDLSFSWVKHLLAAQLFEEYLTRRILGLGRKGPISYLNTCIQRCAVPSLF